MRTCEDCKHCVLWGDSDKTANCYRFPPSELGFRPRIMVTDRACGEHEREEK